MNLFKKLLYAFVFLFGGIQMHLFAQSPNNVVDEVIWVVGDEAILRSDVEAARMVILIVSFPNSWLYRNYFCIRHSWTVWKSRTPRFPPTWRHV